MNLKTVGLLFAVAFIVILSILGAKYAHSHEAHKVEGEKPWSYPMECCSNNDCGVVTKSEYKPDPANPNGVNVWWVTVTSVSGIEMTAPVPHNFKNAKPSPDGQTHACISQFSKMLLCLFVPPNG